MDSVNLKELQLQAHDFQVLYVEDNEALRHNASKFLKKFFEHVDVAEDGQVGLTLFKEKHHPIVITDIKMPNMDGMQLSKYIQTLAPDTKIIVMSAFDDKEFLLQAIELSIFRFLKKPVNVTELSSVLSQAIAAIKHEQHVKMFQMHLKNIFEHQSSMVVLLENSKVVIANDSFLEFFKFESLAECKKSMHSIEENFLEHSGFLYPHDGNSVLDIIQLSPDTLYNVKMKDSNQKVCHFIIKYQTIPEKEGYGVLSFDDVTELNLLKLFDAEQSSEDKVETDKRSIVELLTVIQRNSAKVELHNYYKGLSITNNAVIIEIGDGALKIKTNYMQQKAIQIEHKTLLISNALPFTLELSSVKKINFEQQSVLFEEFKFVKTSPITRKTIRVVPSEKQTVSLFIGDGKYHGDIEIADISLDAVCLSLNTLPPGLEKGTEVVLDMVLELDKKPLIINTKATLYRKQEMKRSFHLVFLFKDLKKSSLVKYISKRQMALIREIKGMQNG